jgi:hypothetical protein
LRAERRAAIDDRRAERRESFQEHETDAAVAVARPVRRVVYDSIRRVDAVSVSVGEHGALARFQNFDARLQELRKPEIVRA